VKEDRGTDLDGGAGERKGLWPAGGPVHDGQKVSAHVPCNYVVRARGRAGRGDSGKSRVQGLEWVGSGVTGLWRVNQPVLDIQAFPGPSITCLATYCHTKQEETKRPESTQAGVATACRYEQICFLNQPGTNSKNLLLKLHQKGNRRPQRSKQFSAYQRPASPARMGSSEGLLIHLLVAATVASSCDRNTCTVNHRWRRIWARWCQGGKRRLVGFKRLR
jgi:hypothetical protein